MEKIKWGIIGPGNIANNFADGLKDSYSGQLVSIASKNEDRRKTFGDKYDIHPDFRFDNYDDIINSEHIDAIYISTPHTLHAEWTIKAAGKAADKQLRGTYGADYKKRPNYSQEKAKLQAQFLATMTQEFGMQFAEGGAVTTDVNMMQATPGGIADVNIEETSTTQPRQDLPQLSYDEIRARLPKEIGDDIVTLLANSYEALADFAEIRTQTDVNSFNTKYQVQLVLPQEA